MKIVKIGGSVITEKDRYRTPRTDMMEKIANVLGNFPGNIVLVHGAGSYGHPKAMEFGLELPGNIAGKGSEISIVINDVLSLNATFSDYLTNHGFRGVTVPPHVIYGSKDPNFSAINDLLKNSFSPILYGDIIMEGNTYRIISGDEICLDLAKLLHPEDVIFATDVDGIFTSDPKEFSSARLYREIKVNEISIGGRGKDATGSMMGKVEKIRAMLPYTKEVKVINGNFPERLRKALDDEEVIGTVIY